MSVENLVIDGKYKIIQKIGSGGMGEVFKSINILTNKILALKIIRKEISQVEDLFQLKCEFQMLKQMNHKNLCHVYDFGFFDGKYYYTMEYIEGSNFYKTLRDYVLSNDQNKWKKFFDIVVQFLQALQYIHFKGIIHLDLKPLNVLITNGNVKILDFGLARSGKISNIEFIYGTPIYIAPEILRGGLVDHRADLYSLGVMLFEVLAGEPPFRGENLKEIISAHLKERPPIELLKDIDCPLQFKIIVEKLLEKDPNNRFNFANEIIHEINTFVKPRYLCETYEELRNILINTPFVGREKELETLKKVFLSNEIEKIFIIGPKGIGKTRLIDEFSIWAQIEGIKLFILKYESEKKEPLENIKLLVKEIFLLCQTHHFDDIKTFMPFLYTLFPEIETNNVIGEKIEYDKLQLFENIIRFLEFARKIIGDFLIIIDDVDKGVSIDTEFLRYLISSLNRRNIKIIITSTEDISDFKEDKNILKIMLNPLDKNCVNLIIMSLVKDKYIAEKLSPILFSGSGGNPLFVQLIIQELIEKRKLRFKDAKWTINKDILISGIKFKGIDTFFDESIKNLDSSEKELLKYASIFPSVWSPKILLFLNRKFSNNIYNNLKFFVKKGIIKEIRANDQILYSFSSEEIRKKIYFSLPTKKKIYLHRKAAKIIKSIKSLKEETISQLAYHYFEGKKYNLAINYMRLAAKNAERIFASNEAINYYRKIILISKLKNSFSKEKLFETYSKLGEILLFTGSVKESFNAFEHALKISKFIKKKKYIIYSNLNIAKIKQHLGKYKSAENILKKMLSFAHKKDKELYTKILSAFASLFYMSGNYEESMKYHNEVIKYYISKDDKKRIGITLNAIGLIYLEKDDNDNAMDYFKKSNEIFRKIRDIQGVALTLGNIGVVLREKGKYREALELQNKSLEIKEEIGDIKGMGVGLQNIGFLNLLMGNFEDSISVFSKALEIFKETKDLHGIIGSLFSIGMVNFKSGHLGKSIKWFEEAVELSEKCGERYYIAISNILLGLVLTDIGDYENARKNLEIALNEARNIGIKSVITEAYIGLAKLYAYLGNKEKTLEFFKLIEDSEDLKSITVPKEEIFFECINILYKIGELDKMEYYYNMFSMLSSESWIHLFGKEFLKGLILFENEPVISRIYFIKALDIAERTNHIEFLYICNYYLALSYLKSGFIRNAYSHLKETIRILDIAYHEIEDQNLKEIYINNKKSIFEIIDKIRDIL